MLKFSIRLKRTKYYKRTITLGTGPLKLLTQPKSSMIITILGHVQTPSIMLPSCGMHIASSPTQEVIISKDFYKVNFLNISSSAISNTIPGRPHKTTLLDGKWVQNSIGNNS